VTATLEAPAEPASDPSDTFAEPAEPKRPIPESLAPWHDPHPWHGWLVTTFVLVFATLTRFWSLGFPKGYDFDEAYYPVEAQEILRYGYEDNRGYTFIVHPPLGKWLIALTEWLWDDKSTGWLTNSVGYRLAPAIAGIAGIIMLTRIARRIFRSNLFAAITGALFCMEGLSLVLARTALLDIFLQTFIIAAFGALVLDRDQMRGRLARLLAEGADLTSGVPTLGPRPWRLIAGVMFGLACAVKWTALSFFVFFVLLSLIWDRAALRAAGVRAPTRHWLKRSVIWTPGAFFLAPLGTYLLCYLGWFSGENAQGRHWADTHSTSTKLNIFGVRIPFNWGWVPAPIRSLGAQTLDAYRFHEGLDSPHIYGSKPWGWLILGRPVNFYYDSSSKACGGNNGCSRHILLIGTPLMWWAFMPMLVWLAWHWFTTRDWRAGAIWVAFAAGWLVWFQDLKRTMFLFYMAPLVPFMLLGLTLALGAMLGPPLAKTGDLWRRRRAQLRRRWGLASLSIYLGIVVADFAWMWPIFTGGLRTYDVWHAHMWFQSWV